MKETRATIRKKPLAVLLALAAIVAILPPFTGESRAADTCKEACTLYTTCVGEIQGKTPTPKQSKELLNGCMQTCQNAKYNKKVIQCYTNNKSQNSCNNYAQCIITSAQ